MIAKNDLFDTDYYKIRSKTLNSMNFDLSSVNLSNDKGNFFEIIYLNQLNTKLYKIRSVKPRLI